MRHDQPATMMHLIRPILFLLVLLLVVLWAEFASADSVRIHDLTGSDGPEVTLEQVAELEGDYAQTLAQTVVGQFADGEDEVLIELSEIERILRDAEASLGRLELQGFASCRVVRVQITQPQPEESVAGETPVANPERLEAPITVDSPTTVRATIQRQIADGLGLSADELVFEFSDRDERHLVRSTVAGRNRVESDESAQLGRMTFRVYRFQGTEQVENHNITVAIKQRVLMVVAADHIGRNEIIRRGSVRMREELIDGQEGQIITQTSVAIGQVAARAMQPGDWVTASMIQAPLAVRRRDSVNVSYQRPGVTITFTAEAMEEGSLGQMIEVKNSRTGEAFAAEIVGRQRVRVTTQVAQETTQNPE